MSECKHEFIKLLDMDAVYMDAKKRSVVIRVDKSVCKKCQIVQTTERLTTVIKPQVE